MIKNNSNDFLMDIGKFIKKKRQDKKMTQFTLARKINVTHQQIHLYESGKNNIPITKLKDIVSILEIKDIGNLFDGKKPEAKGIPSGTQDS